MEDASSAEIARPFSITLVSGFQFFKAIYLVFFFAKSWKVLLAFPVPGKIDAEGLFRYLFLLMLPVAAVYSLVIGWGLWRLRGWARRLLISAIVNCWMIGTASFNGPLFGGGILPANWQNRTLICVLLVDLLVYGCLAWYPGVSEAFDAHRTSPSSSRTAQASQSPNKLTTDH
jgi:hypothetical protein